MVWVVPPLTHSYDSTHTRDQVLFTQGRSISMVLSRPNTLVTYVDMSGDIG